MQVLGSVLHIWQFPRSLSLATHLLPTLGALLFGLVAFLFAIHDGNHYKSDNHQPFHMASPYSLSNTGLVAFAMLSRMDVSACTLSRL